MRQNRDRVTERLTGHGNKGQQRGRDSLGRQEGGIQGNNIDRGNRQSKGKDNSEHDHELPKAASRARMLWYTRDLNNKSV